MDRESILVTGITGFVGRHLAALLNIERQHEVSGTYAFEEELVSGGLPEGLRMIECRLEDRDSVEKAVNEAKPSIVYHLAGQSSVSRSIKDPVETFQTNVMGTVHLLEALRKQTNLRAIVLVSSAEVYGIVPESSLPVDENVSLNPNNPYAWSKACVEMIGDEYWSDFGLPIIKIRPFNHIGPGQSDAFAASSFARQIAEIEAGLRPPQLCVGNLEARRDFTDVRDIVRAYVMMTKTCAPGEVYNLCSGSAVSLADILQKLLSFTSAKIEITADPERLRPADLPILLGNCGKFRTVTGWSLNIPIDQTLDDLLNYWRSRVA